jgi:hypothetical protein
MLDLAPPNWVWNLALRTMPFRSVAQSIYFHRRGEPMTNDASAPAPGRRADQKA